MMAKWECSDEFDTVYNLTVSYPKGVQADFSIFAGKWYDLLLPKVRRSKAQPGSNDILVVPELRSIFCARTVIDVLRLYKDDILDISLLEDVMICNVRGSKTSFSFRRLSVETFKEE